MDKKKYTQEDMNNARRFFQLEGENKLLKRILEQKLEIELIPKLRI